MAMPAGRRIHEVVLQEPSGSPVADGDGDFVESYTDLSPRTLFVSIEPATAARLERLAAGTSIASASLIVSGPYHAGVTTQTRLTFGTRTLYVVGVMYPEERQIETIMLCTEVRP